MQQANAEELRSAVEAQYGGKATLYYVAHVIDPIQGNWDGRVLVFYLEGGSSATKVYAWSLPVPGSMERRLYTARENDGINGPADAVRATLESSGSRASAG